jgi:hypothetical protein
MHTRRQEAPFKATCHLCETSSRLIIIAFATENRLPAVYHNRGYAFDGGLVSYGPNIPDAYRTKVGCATDDEDCIS